jgi:hypothetical protein
MLAQSLTNTSTPEMGTPQAILTFAALGNLVTHLKESAARYGTATVPPAAAREHIPASGFDLDVAGIALATAARIFDFDPKIIALIDDAQFHRRPVHIAPARGGAPVMTAAATERRGTDDEGSAAASLACRAT